MTRKVVSPIALDKSINTTEQTPRNIADVLAQQLEAIKTAIESGNGNLEAAFVCYYGVTTATQIKDAIEDGKVPYFYYNGVVAQLWKVETDKYTFRTTNTRSVEGQTILDVVDYVVNGSVWSTVTREVSGGSSSGQSYIASVNSLADFDTTGKSGMQDLISVANVPADGVYQVSVMLHITPKTASATKSDLVLQFTSSDNTGWPSHTFHAVVDDSQTFAQQLSFSTSVSLKAGQNTLRIQCGGLNTEYLVFVDELTVAQLVNGVYHNGDDFSDVHTLTEAPDFNNDDGVLVDGSTGGPRFMFWKTLARKILRFFGIATQDDSEYVYAVTDNNKKFLFGIKKTGDIEWAKGIPAPIKNVLDTLSNTISGKVDSIDGKSLINSIFASGISVVTNEEFSFAITDHFGRFLIGVRTDGSIDWQKGIPLTISNALNTKVEKVEGKGIVDKLYGDSLNSISDNEFLYVVKDTQNRIIAAIRQDGSIYTGLPIEGLNKKQNKVEGKTVIDDVFSNSASHKSDSEYAYAITDSRGYVLFGIRNDGSFECKGIVDLITGGESSIATTSYVDNKVDEERLRAEGAEQELERAISEIEPVIVEGGENTPDNVFITSNENDAITLKNNNPYTFGFGVYNVLPSDDSSVFSKTRTIYNIRFPLNLEGETIELPQDVVLNFCGGFISNGELVGNDTIAKFTKNCVQNNVTFSGTWNIPYISSDILTSPEDSNSLKILCNLLSEDYYNVLHIKPGSYIFNPLQNADNFIFLKSNTKLIVDGDIAIAPNGYTNYSIVRAENSKNIEILGKGSIAGDADEHDYTTIPSTHEWGMCINVAGCENVYIHDITLKDATGDGIDISEKSAKEPKQIMVCRCNITHCGRQGISVTAGEQIKISNCLIDDIYRTAPMAAVDLEANSGHRVAGVDVEDLIVSRCKGLMAIHSDFVSFRNIKSLNCTSLFYFEDAKFVDVFDVYSSSNVASSDFIRATNDCEDIVFSKVNTINNEESFVVNLNYIQTDYLCNFGSASIASQPKEGSTKYSSGKFLQYNGINWVNFDGTST